MRQDTYRGGTDVALWIDGVCAARRSYDRMCDLIARIAAGSERAMVQMFLMTRDMVLDHLSAHHPGHVDPGEILFSLYKRVFQSASHFNKEKATPWAWIKSILEDILDAGGAPRARRA